MKDAILILNAGSSSLKFAVYEAGTHPLLRLKGTLSRLAHEPRLKMEADGQTVCDRLLGRPMTLASAAENVFAQLGDQGFITRIAAVGHRIVHGGRAYTQPTILNPTTLETLRRLVPLAPLHQPYNLDIVDLAARLLPDAHQIGCFDTAFHAERPLRDRLYGLPRRLSDEGVIAYGFHGLSYAHIAAKLRAQDGERAGGRAIVAHLGSGASLCAMDSGAQRRHYHGVLGPRRPGDELAVRIAGPGRRASPFAGSRHEPGRGQPPAL
jgi:acetate kinase